MSSTIRRPETELYQETYGTRFYDDPELAQVFYPDEARTDALIAEAVQLDLAALEQWCEQRDAADPHNVLVEE